MENKNKAKQPITIKKLNRAFGIAAFVLVFVFTFALIDETVKSHMAVWGIALGCSIAALGIAWLITILVFKNKQDKNDPNKQKIKQALDSIEKEQKEKQKGLDESNS